MKHSKILNAVLSVSLVVTAATGSVAAADCPCQVDYNLGGLGTSAGMISEKVTSGKTASNIPEVDALTNLSFIGWSLTDPSTLKEDEEAELVDPESHEITDSVTFYAVYGSLATGFHEAFVKGYPNGMFGPEDNITRGEVATIIARACLDDFAEGYNYGTGGYDDIEGHWAQSAIAFCTDAEVFAGYGDGTFRPNQPITRQEFATAFSRMAGMLEYENTPFTDIDDTASWAMDGVYTAYANGWINGYTDGTFLPLNNIQRSEAVKIVNRYLNRGTDADGIKDVLKDIRQWPDVSTTHWAYYEIIEAANDHYYFYNDGEFAPETYTEIFGYLD